MQPGETEQLPSSTSSLLLRRSGIGWPNAAEVSPGDCTRLLGNSRHACDPSPRKNNLEISRTSRPLSWLRYIGHVRQLAGIPTALAASGRVPANKRAWRKLLRSSLRSEPHLGAESEERVRQDVKRT